MNESILRARPQHGFAYIASPYSHDEPFVREQRYLYAAKYTSDRLLNRDHVYSPIVHCHELAKTFNLRGDFTFWRDYNFSMLARAYELRILRIDGWDHSLGVTAERQFAIDNEIPVVYV